MALGADALDDADLPQASQVQPTVVAYVAALDDPQHPIAGTCPGPPPRSGEPLIHVCDVSDGLHEANLPVSYR